MENKRCSKCGNKYPIECFSREKRSKDGLKSWCKFCCRKQSKIYNKKYYLKNKEKFKEINKKNQFKIKLRHKKNREFIQTLKTSCKKCGEKRLYIIQFHHIDYKKKKFEIGSMGSAYSRENLLNEVKKCICFCSNCHDEFHYIYGKQATKENLKEYLDIESEG
ncbi:hypothetical protein FDB41_15070 [Clostridium botulinum]|nr:hypothetical protein [Clostridium botulinum]NFO54830.1 hypothetical protein [Clostridium botulinum]